MHKPWGDRCSRPGGVGAAGRGRWRACSDPRPCWRVRWPEPQNVRRPSRRCACPSGAGRWWQWARWPHAGHAGVRGRSWKRESAWAKNVKFEECQQRVGDVRESGRPGGSGRRRKHWFDKLRHDQYAFYTRGLFLFRQEIEVWSEKYSILSIKYTYTGSVCVLGDVHSEHQLCHVDPSILDVLQVLLTT